MPEPTKNQFEMMRHACGMDDREPFWRNNYCTEKGDKEWEALVEMGLALRGRVINQGEDQYYHVSNAGKELLRDNTGERGGGR